MKRRLAIIMTAVIIGCLLISQGTNFAEPASGAVAGSEAGAASASAPVDEQTAESTVASGDSGKAASIAEGMDKAAENEFLILYVNNTTTEIAVQDKRSGAIWYSNPQDREQDPIATGYNKAKLNVQVEISYLDAAGNSVKYDNYTHSVQSGQYVIEKVSDGLNIVYTLGEVKSDIDTIPKYISEERFQTLILDKIEDSGDKREVEKRFKHNEQEKRYERRDSSLKGVGLKKVTEVFEQIGYDEEQKAIDNAASGEAAASDLNVKIPLHYRLDGEQLKVTVDSGGVEYPESMKIQTLSLLPFFGASGLEDEGYTLVPDGSGSLIRFNNEKTYATPFRKELYGTDSAIRQQIRIQNDEAARLPVFGMKYEDRAFVGIIEEGDAVAAVEADISGRLNVYNTVSPSFKLRNLEEVTLTNGWRSSTVKKFQAAPFQGNISVRYGFLGAEDASYSGMATEYRNYLIKQAGLTRLTDEEGVPFYAELIGGIPKKKFFLGIPYNAYEPLTTFDQAESVLGQMLDLGIGNIKLRYTGWFNGGIIHDLAKSITVDKKLGGSKGLNELKAYADANHISLFPDATFLEAAPNADGFKKSQASRFINGKLAHIYPYSAANFREEDEQEPGYVLSPNSLPQIVNGFIDDYEKLQLSGVSLRDLGSMLNSDFNRSNVIDREEAKEIVSGQLQQISGSVKEILVEGGNAYAAAYARHIVDAPMTSSGFIITDETVPFFQSVFHGYINYAGTAWNMADDQDSTYNFLKALETGSAMHFTWFNADSSAIKMTEFDHLYSADYRLWIDEASQRYRELNDVLHDVQSQIIADHRMLADGVYQTTFEKGKTIIVNYNDTESNVDGIIVGAKDYWVGGETQR
ncbi:DUF5696 domain-containing protein [Paenibacillus sp. LHD-38]|uniref:DUF5696 domain-containing protein n=1 Tax=Paenibacillus sp. LHD-38 TaxID=3072143 RepID=UPI00280F27BA|nr:DUF5696 domain-containing protein [Paenibacillus sp. LHD-38]MDQ8734556.1 DUF5696 domain-containing protein [Paenibacillus sp. LHD-38]